MSATKRVAVTIDTEHADGPPAPDGAIFDILDVLGAAAVSATFFLQGRWARSQPAACRRIVADGHLVGHHSYSHTNLSLLTEHGLATELDQGRHSIIEAAGVDPAPWFRCPYGTHSHSPRLFPVLAAQGFHDVHWNVAVEDWERACTPEVLADRAAVRTAAGPADVVLLLHSWPPAMHKGLAPLLSRLADQGAEFVTVDRLATVEPSPSWCWL